jgi:hypothetical protein
LGLTGCQLTGIDGGNDAPVSSLSPALLPAYVVLRVHQVTEVDSSRLLPTRPPTGLAWLGFAPRAGKVKICGLGMLGQVGIEGGFEEAGRRCHDITRLGRDAIVV